MVLRIYKPAKTAMQSGNAKTKNWIAEYISENPSKKDILMGWNSSSDTKSQIKVYFDSKEKAVSWAKKNTDAVTSIKLVQHVGRDFLVTRDHKYQGYFLNDFGNQ